MKTSLLGIFFILVAASAFAQAADHTDVVRAAKAAAVAAGITVDADECSRFEVTQRVAVLLAGEGAGLLFKNSGNNCRERAVDIIAYPSGRIFDILGAGDDGPNTPHWMELTPVTPDRWRAPFDVTTPPAPAPTPAEPPATQEDHDAILRQITAQLETLTARLALLDEKVNTLRTNDATEHQAIRDDIHAFREAAGNVAKQLLQYVPAILSAIGLLKK